MSTGVKTLRDEVTSGVSRLIVMQLILTLVLLMVVSVAGGYYLLQTELDYKKRIVSTRISTELSSIASSLDALASSPVLWTALTDTTDRDAFLSPLLQSLNRSDAFKVAILDYRGREILSPDEPLVDAERYQSFLMRNVGERTVSLSVLVASDNQTYIGILFPIVSPLSDSVVGHALSTFSVSASLEQLKLSPDTIVALSFEEPLNGAQTHIWGKQGFLRIATTTRELIKTPAGDFVFYVEVSESYRKAVGWFLAFLALIVVGGLIALRRGRRWANEFSRKTLYRLEQLLELSRQIIQGKSVGPMEDDRADEISEIRHTLGQLLTDQRRNFEHIRTSASVFTTAGEAIMITSADGKIIDVNPALIDITGYERAELIGTQAGKLYRSGHESVPDERISRALERQGQWRGETVFFDKHDCAVPVQLAVTRIYDESGQDQGQVAVFTDIREIKQAEERLRRYAYQDVLTELPNYRAFSEALANRLTAENAAAHPFLLIFIDLDRLKQINDMYGHERGDQVIRDIAAHISEVLPEGHLLCRRSGDEFLALVDFNDADELESIRRRLDRHLNAYSIAIEMETLFTSISAGVTIFPKFSQNYTSLLQQADAALYEAKKDRSQKRVVWYAESLGERINRRLHVENVLEKAILSGAILAHFQPEVEMPSGRVIGFEALARWKDPVLGQVGPDEFIPLAEESGLIAPLTQRILTQVIDSLPLIRQHIEGASVSVNISPQLFINRQITDLLINLMDERQTDLDGLVIEITESDLSLNPVYLTAQLNTIRGLGVKVAIDDFGKGYSSLSRLTSMPLDKLKIDASFVSGNSGRIQKDIIDVIMALSHKLKLSVTAEGVETEEQMQALVESGCRHAQGWYFSKAMPIEQALSVPRYLQPVDIK